MHVTNVQDVDFDLDTVLRIYVNARMMQGKWKNNNSKKSKTF